MSGRAVRPRLGAALALVLAVALAPSPARAAASAAAAVTVYAAASLGDVLPLLATRYRERTGVPVSVSLAASSLLARQIESGAPADVFVSADEAWMDQLVAHGLVRAPSRIDLLGNRLVLVAARDSTLRLRIAPRFALREALGDGRLATGNTESVPAGRYAKAALVSLGVYDSVESRLVLAENVRAALAFVARGEAPLGIVYATDAKAEPRVRVVDVFPEDSHPPVRYPAALTTTASPAASDFLRFLRSAEAAAVFAAAGFTPLGPAPP